MTSGKMVWVAICGGSDPTKETRHIFSTPEACQTYCDTDKERWHVIYDYVIDHPERMEGIAQ